MREHKKKWLCDKGKTSGSRKYYGNSGGDFAWDRNSKEFQDLEYTPAKQNGMQVKHNRGGRKHALSFRPLLRFLKGKVGKDWNIIYSEIKERIPKDVWETHNPIKWYVYTKVRINEDGSISDTRRSGIIFGVISTDGKTCKFGRYASYYIHPETNLLCRLEPATSPGKKGKEKLTKKEGKKKYAEHKTYKNKSKANSKKIKEDIGKEASEKMIEKKKQSKLKTNDTEEQSSI